MKRVWLTVFLILCLLLVSGVIFRHRTQINNQNKQFQKTQSWLREALDEIGSSYPNSERISDPHCRRPSAKYEKTERYCVTDELLIIPQSSSERLQKSTAIQVSLTQKLGVTFKDLGTNELTDEIRAYSFAKNSLNCFISYYNLDNENGTSYSPKLTSIYNGLLVSASCSGLAMADYFPSRD